LQLAYCQRVLGLMSEALDTAHAAVECQFGKDPLPLLLAAELESLSGRLEVSRKLLARAAPLLVAAKHLRLQHAHVLILHREWAAARELLETAILERPLDPQAHLLLARCHLAAGEWQASFDHAILSVGLDASKARIHELLGHALLGLGMRHQAWQSFEKATLIEPGWPRPWAKIAMLARQMNKPAAEIRRHTENYQKVKEDERARDQALATAARPVPTDLAHQA
jgi:tetratricopeptide (TPR) repeat protein